VTIEELNRKLDKFSKELESNNWVEIGARSTITRMGERIFERGLNTDGRKMGEYSTTPAIINTESAPRTLPNDSFFRFKQPSRRGKKGYFGTFFAGGYDEFKTSQGRNQGFVNLKLSGEMQGDFLNGFVKKGKLGAIVAFKKTINAKKRETHERKYGTIFDASKSEIKNFEKVVTFELLKALPI
jgi:hypothetical protein